MWLAGGGVKGGIRYGATDEHGSCAVENKFHLHDLHATILHLLGLDHQKLTYRYGGRDYSLTDIHGLRAHLKQGFPACKHARITRFGKWASDERTHARSSSMEFPSAGAFHQSSTALSGIVILA